MNIPDPVATALITAGALEVAKQGQDFIAAAAGHPGQSLGTIVGNWTNRQFLNTEVIGNKAHLILLGLGTTPKEVPLNVLHPLLESASLQENPDLQDIWAKLLANAANPEYEGEVLLAFVSMLKELTPREVKFLDCLYEAIERVPVDKPPLAISADTGGYTVQQLFDLYGEAGLLLITKLSRKPTEEEAERDRNDFQRTLGLVVRTGIMSELPRVQPIEVQRSEGSSRYGIPSFVVGEKFTLPTKTVYNFTNLGWEFVEACRI
jgi:hypothetical protein